MSQPRRGGILHSILLLVVAESDLVPDTPSVIRYRNYSAWRYCRIAERGRVGAAPINPAGTAGGSCGPLPALLEPCHRLAWPLSAKWQISKQLKPLVGNCRVIAVTRTVARRNRQQRGFCLVFSCSTNHLQEKSARRSCSPDFSSGPERRRGQTWKCQRAPAFRRAPSYCVKKRISPDGQCKPGECWASQRRCLSSVPGNTVCQDTRKPPTFIPINKPMAVAVVWELMRFFFPEQ